MSQPNPHLAWTKAEGEYLQHAIGRLGEQTLAYHLGQEGYVILYGTGGSTRFPRGDTRKVHQPNTKGLDMLAYHPKTGEILILDNKAGAAGGAIDDVGAFTKDLRKKLLNRINKLERGRAHLPPDAQKMLDKALKDLKAAEQALGGKGKWPGKVRLAVANAAGGATGISKDLAQKLGKFGIRFIDVNAVRQVAKLPKTRRTSVKAGAALLRQRANKAELDALRRLSKRATAKGTAEVLEKAAPKIVGKFLLRAAAAKAARRTASLLPVVGWGFAAKDAYAGVEDIFRGHTARGLAGVGMAIGDVASDFLHIGDAVSGVGGTVLSIGAQGALIAGQMGIEMDRLKEKMEELQKEIGRTGQLPDDRRLRDEFDLDDDAIKELKDAMRTPPPEEPTEADLPPPPDWGQQYEPIFADPPPLPPQIIPLPNGGPAPPRPSLPRPPPASGPNAPFWDQPIA